MHWNSSIVAVKTSVTLAVFYRFWEINIIDHFAGLQNSISSNLAFEANCSKFTSAISNAISPIGYHYFVGDANYIYSMIQ